jgi:hypothetical protein
MVTTQPKLSPTLITSPGFTDLSASRMMPLTRLDTIFCRPKPTPTPTAPENTASAEMSMPTALSTIMMPRPIRVQRITWRPAPAARG